MDRLGRSLGGLLSATARSLAHPTAVAVIGILLLGPSAGWLAVDALATGGPTPGASPTDADDRTRTFSDPIAGEVTAEPDALSPPDEDVDHQVEASALAADVEAPAEHDTPTVDVDRAEADGAARPAPAAVDAAAPEDLAPAEPAVADVAAGQHLDEATPTQPAERSGDGVPERWVVGAVTLEDEARTLGERVRVLAGSTLVLSNTTLSFEAHPDGPTGLVAEPGSRVVLDDATVQGAGDAAAPLTVHLEGETVVEGADVLDARRVVVQPRSATDHLDQVIGPELDGEVPGWQALRATANATARLSDLTTRAEGPGLVLGVPTPRQTYVPRPSPALTVDTLDVAAQDGPGVVCYETHRAQDPAPAEDPPTSAAGRAMPSQLTLGDATVHAPSGDAVACPPQPTAYPAPTRSAPTGTLAAEATPSAPEDALTSVGEQIPAPPAPAAREGPDELALDGGHLEAAGHGVAMAWGFALDATGTTFEDADGAVAVLHEDAQARVVKPDGVDLARGLVAHDGALAVHGGSLAGAPGAEGLVADNATVELDRTGLTGFTTGVAASGSQVTVAKTALTGTGADAATGLAATGSALELYQATVEAFPAAAAIAHGTLVAEGIEATGTGASGPAIALTDARAPLEALHARGFTDGLTASGSTVWLNASTLEGQGTGTAVATQATELSASDTALEGFADGLAATDGQVRLEAVRLAGASAPGTAALNVDGTALDATRVTATGFASGLAARGAPVTLADSQLTGLGAQGTGLAADGGTVTVTDTRLASFGTGMAVADATLDAARVTVRGPGAAGPGLALTRTTARLATANVTGYQRGLDLLDADATATGLDVEAADGADAGVAAESSSLALDRFTVEGFPTGAALTGGTLDAANGRLVGTGPGTGLTGTVAGATLDQVTVTGFEDGASLADGTLTATGATFQGTGPGAGLALPGTDATVDASTVTAYRDGVLAGGPLALEDTTVRADRTCLEVEQATGSVTDASLTRCEAGIVLDRSSGVSVSGTTFTDVVDPLAVQSPDTERAHYDHAVSSTTVEGKSVEYLFEASGTDVSEPGDVVVAFSQDVHVHDLVPRTPRWSVAASENVVLDTYTDDQGTLAAAYGTSLGEAVTATHEDVNFEPYPGAMKGPNATAEQARGNQIDQAWLMLERAEALGLEARLVDGELSISHEAFLNWTRMEDLDEALKIPGFSGAVGPDEVHLDHSWAEVRVEPGVWVAVDPSFEQYRPVSSPDWQGETGLTNESHYDAFMEDVEKGDGWARNIPIEMLANNTTQGHERFPNLVDLENHTTAEIFGGHVPRAVDHGQEPDHDPQDRSTNVTEDRQWSVEIKTWEPGTPTQGEINVTGAVPDVYGDKLTLAGSPHSEEDLQRVVDNGSIFNMSRNAVEYSTVLWQDERPVDVDGKWDNGTDSAEVRPDHSADRHPGDPLRVSVHVKDETGSTVYNKTSPIRVGGTYSIVLDVGRMAAERMFEAGQTLERNMDNATDGNATSLRETLGSFHRSAGTFYFAQTGFASATLARQMDIQAQPLVSTAVAGNALLPVVNGTREEVRMGPPSIDVQGLENAFHASDNQTKEFGYNFGSGIYSSLYEDHIKTQLYNLPAVSTIKVLNVANLNDERIYQLDSSNAGDKLSELNHPRTVKKQIVGAINEGKKVLVPQNQIEYFNWTGSAWAEIDPDTGVSGWLIHGGVSLGGEVAPSTHATTLQGGAGAQRTPLDTAVNLVDAGYENIPAPSWTSKGLGALSAMTEGIPTVHSTIDGKWFTHDRAFVSGKLGWNGDISIRQADEVAPRGITFTDELPTGVTKAGKAAGVVGTSISFYSDFNKVMMQPGDDRPLTDKFTDPELAGELAARWGWNAGSMVIEAKAAASGAAVGGTVCSAAPVLGTAVCGVAGAGIAAVGTAYVSDRAKETAIDWGGDVVSAGTDLVSGLF